MDKLFTPSKSQLPSSSSTKFPSSALALVEPKTGLATIDRSSALKVAAEKTVHDFTELNSQKMKQSRTIAEISLSDLLFQEAKSELAAVVKPETNPGSVTTEPEKDAKAEKVTPKAPEVVPDNEFEKRIRPEVIPAEEINVTFEDILR